jgi:hypothetical protein
MNRPQLRTLAACAATLAAVAAAQQMPDMAVMQRWEKVKIVHYEVVGEITLKGHQIPAADADLYADVTDRVRLSFDWDKQKGVIIGKPTITNETGSATNVQGVDKLSKGKKQCPSGKINGTYEHFDVVEVRQPQPGMALELIGKRVHPETQVAEACSSNLKTYKGATREAKEHIMPPDPMMLAMAKLANVPTIKVSPDGKSIVMGAQNSKWVWTFTPTAR